MQVHADREGLYAVGLDFGGGLVQGPGQRSGLRPGVVPALPGVDGARSEGDVESLLGQSQGGGLPDPSAGSRDQGDRAQPPMPSKSTWPSAIAVLNPASAMTSRPDT